MVSVTALSVLPARAGRRILVKDARHDLDAVAGQVEERPIA